MIQRTDVSALLHLCCARLCVFSFRKCFCKTFAINILLQPALQPLWFKACSSNVEYSQQEGFYRVPLPAARQTPNLEDQWFRTFHLPPQGVPSASKRCRRTPVAEGGNMSEKLPRILPKVATSTSFLGSFTTWDRRLYFLSEGRRAEDFFSP